MEAEVFRLEAQEADLRKRERLRQLEARKEELSRKLMPKPPNSPRPKNVRTRRVALASEDEESSRRDTVRNLDDLRTMDDLKNQAEKNMKTIGIFDVSSATDTDSSTSSTEKRKKKSSHKKKAKSGKHQKLSSHVKVTEKWPHAYLANSQAGVEDKVYDNLTISEFVAGYSTILCLRQLSGNERQARTEHLSQLMYLAGIYEWKAVLNFHSMCLLQIERKVLRWGDSFSHLESISLAGRLLAKSETLPSSKRNQVFCWEYNKGICSHADSHTVTWVCLAGRNGICFTRVLLVCVQRAG